MVHRLFKLINIQPQYPEDLGHEQVQAAAAEMQGQIRPLVVQAVHVPVAHRAVQAGAVVQRSQPLVALDHVLVALVDRHLRADVGRLHVGPGQQHGFVGGQCHTRIERGPDGSSPQAWGTPRMPVRHVSAARFIPTGVGNTLFGGSGSTLIAVHPHRRGEHSGMNFMKQHQDGSSPQAWGTRPPVLLGTVSFPVHPHRRGEHCSPATLTSVWAGSSPQAWGTHGHNHDVREVFRFIPTGVGNTYPLPVQSADNVVHPHRRGEHEISFERSDNVSGSSPQAWGTLHGAERLSLQGRFIPTGVGNTSPR